MHAQEKPPIIVFDDSVKVNLIKALGYTINEQGYLVGRNGKIAVSQEFEPISVDNFGGVLQGSKIPIKNDEMEIVRYFLNKILKE